MTARDESLDCQEAMERLYTYLDGELTPEAETTVRAHLEACAPCFQLFDFEEAFLRFLEARSRAHGAPPALRRRILDTLLLDSETAEPT